jgi:RHS repeat-associated protein
MKRLLIGLVCFLGVGVAVAAPTVSMTSPSNGALYLAPGTLPVKANASSPGATVVQVEFFANGVSIGVDTTSPYQFDWSGVAAGTYAITATVTDSNGATATSAPRNITVAATNTPPTVSLSGPADNARYLNPTSITISATASGPELNDIIQSVQFYLNGNLANTITSAPFSYGATGLANGIYTLTAVATDSQGAQTTSTARTFTVSDTNVPPTVSLVTPLANSAWNGPTATVPMSVSVNSGEANDTVSVEFFANGTSLGVRPNAPYSITANLASAVYSITAVATDGQGAQTTSAARTITVSDTNNPPTIVITSPVANANYPNPPIASIAVNTTPGAGEVNGWVTKVELYANNALIATRTSGPWNFTWTNVAQGVYSLTAKAFDNFNASTTSAPTLISVGPLPPKVDFVFSDHLGTPRLIEDGQQRIVWRYDNTEPFGDSVPNEDPSGLGASEFPLSLSLYYRDKETANLYAMYRDAYSPAIGRFPQSDPIGLGGGLNTYAYVVNGPINFIDPLGLSPCRCKTKTVPGAPGQHSFKDKDSIPKIIGKVVLIACDYECVKANGNKEIVRATHSERSFGIIGDTGQEGNCLGAEYDERWVPNLRGAQGSMIRLYFVKSYREFDPESSGSSQLEQWAKASCECKK